MKTINSPAKSNKTVRSNGGVEPTRQQSRNLLPSWFHKLPEIIDVLDNLPDDCYLDRQACEVLFGLRQTQAGIVLRRLGAITVGRCLAIRRRDLAKQLRSLAIDPAFSRLVRNRKRVADVIKTEQRIFAAKAIKIGESRDQSRRFDDLPGVQLEGSRLIIEHSGPEDLLRKLYALAQSIAADPDRFMAGVSSRPG